MPTLPQLTYERFAEFLLRRIESKKHLTEDSVRYSFFLALLQTTGIQQHEIVLELPHPRFPGKEIDTYVAATDGRKELFFEFKFHRKTSSVSATPQKAGSLFKDISRLAPLVTDERQCLIVYFTCGEMAKYFTKNETSYSSFWRHAMGDQFLYDQEFLAKTTNTFRVVSGEHHDARVVIEFSAALPDDYHIRVFDVRRI